MSLLLSPPPGVPAGTGIRRGGAAMIRAACWPALTSYLAATLLLAGLTAGAGGSVEWLARVGAMGWLVAHHVPVTIDGAPLGVLPLLPSAGVGALIARSAAGAAMRLKIDQPADAGWMAGVFAATHGLLGAVVTLMATPATVTADPGQAALACALLAGVSAGIGLARPCGLVPAALRQAPSWVRPGLEAGLWGLAVLLAAGLTAVLLALTISADAVFRMMSADAAGALGLIVLSIAYLPNAAIAAVSWLAGPGLSIGALDFGPLASHPGSLPGFPLFAAVPQAPAQPWWVAALAVPLLVGAAAGRRRVIAASDQRERLRIVGVVAVVLALGSAILAELAGGRLGAAAFDPVEIPVGMLMVAVLILTWLGGAGATLPCWPLAGPAEIPADATESREAIRPSEAEIETGTETSESETESSEAREPSGSGDPEPGGEAHDAAEDAAGRHGGGAAGEVSGPERGAGTG